MNTIRRIWSKFGGMGVLGLSLSLLGVTGCATDHYGYTYGSQADYASRLQAQVQQDQALAINVRDALAASPVYKYSGVGVTAERGRVELHGIVPTEAQRVAAAEIAARVPGVASVDNDLAIGPVPGYPETGAVVPTLPARPPY
jgi:osmotically-inducible protein OsmY